MTNSPRRLVQSFKTILTMVVTTILGLEVLAQDAVLDPSDMYFTEYTYEKEGKALLERKEYNAATQKFINAQKLLNTIHTRFPRWNPNIVKGAHHRVSQLIKKVEYEKEKDELAKADVPKLYQEPSKTPRLDEVKRKAALALQKNQKLETTAERVQRIEKDLEEKKREIEQQKIAAADRAELVKIINAKDAELDKLNKANDGDSTSATQREKLLRDEITELRKQLSQNINNPILQNAAQQEREAEIQVLRKQVETLEAQRRELAKTNTAQSELLKNNTKEITELKAVIVNSAQQLENETRESNRKINEINQSLTTLAKQKEETEEKLEIARAKVKEHATAQNNLPTNLLLNKYDDNDAKMIVKLKADAIKLEEKRLDLLEKKKAEIASVQAREEKLKYEITEAKEKLDIAQQATAEKDKELTTLKAKLNTLIAQDKEAQDKILSQTDQISILESDMEALKQERDLLLMRPLKTEVLSLQEDLDIVTKEKQGLSAALATNEEKYYAAMERINQFQKKLEETRGVTSDFEKNVEAEREISNEIIKTQRQRLADQQSKLNETQRALAAEQKKAANFQQIINETTQQYADLDNRYESLIAEHEHLKTLIDGNSDTNILRQQHLKIKSELLSSQKAYKALLEQENTRQEDLTMARKQYALALTDLNKARHQLELSNMRSDKLRNQLVRAQSELKLAESNPGSGQSEGEIKLLRDLVDRQLKLQKNRQLARSIILEQVKRLNIDDTEFINALNLSETQELVLSKEQKQLLANPDADSEFRFTDRATPAEREQAQAELTKKLQIHDKMGRDAFQKGRYAAAEEFFKLNLDAHPGHVPSMLNLGVLQLRHAKNGGDIEAIPAAIETFEDAIAMSGEQTVSFAHQMLGYAHYLSQNFEEATKEFKLVLDQDPTNANAHILLADIAGESNNLKSSEAHLQSAIKIDATMTEPHYNLAKLYSYQGKYQQALKQYRAAIRKGATPDAELEAKLQEALPSGSF